MNGGSNDISLFIRTYNNTLMKHELKEIGFKESEINLMSDRDVDIYLTLHQKNQERMENERGG